MKLRVGLVVPVLNSFDQAIDLVYSAKTKHELKIYIQPQYRHQFPLAAAWNRGIREAIADKCDIIIVANDDVLFAPYTIDELADYTFGMEEINVMAFGLDVFDVLDDPSEILFDERREYVVDDNKEDQQFALFAIRPNFFDLCGTFDENFDPAWWEDTDMKYRIALLWYNAVQTNIPYVHLRHQTTKKLTAPLNSLKSGEYYVRKWGSANRNLTEAFKTPYNDNLLSPKEWR